LIFVWKLLLLMWTTAAQATASRAMVRVNLRSGDISMAMRNNYNLRFRSFLIINQTHKSWLDVAVLCVQRQPWVNKKERVGVWCEMGEVGRYMLH